MFIRPYPINVGYNACKAVCLKRQSNLQWLFLPHINNFKKVGNHSVPGLEKVLFYSLLLNGRGIYAEVWVN